MLALAPGLGKTLCAIIAAKTVGGKVLVVSPVSLCRNWKVEIKKWLGEDAQIWRQHLGISSDWVITNYETILSEWVDFDLELQGDPPKKVRTNWRCIVEHDFNVLIIDESILIKNRKAQRSQAVEALAKTFPHIWELSGSPTTKYLDDLWQQFHTLDSERFSSYWKFAQKYCFVEKNTWGYQIVGNQPEAYSEIMQSCSDIYFSRTQDQVLDLPDWIFERNYVELGAAQYRHYKEMEDYFLTTLPDGDVVLSPNILSQMMRLVQFASNPVLVGGNDEGAKWDALAESLEFVQFPIIVWTNFIQTADMMKTRLSKTFNVQSLTGQTPEFDRQKHVESFQNGGIDILFAHPGVGKFGHTLTRAKTAVYLERSYNGDDYYQSLHRVRRIGTTQSPYILLMIAARPNGNNLLTIDGVIDRVLESKRDASLKITGGLIRDLFRQEM
jgi:SNF2 family DNA or RNA helicase